MTRQARLCSKVTSTGQLFREEWRPVAEAEKYLTRRKSLEDSPYSKTTNWIEYSEDDQ